MTAELEKIILANTKAFTLYKLDQSILSFEYADNLVIEIDDVKSAFNFYAEHSPELTLKVLITFGKHSTITSEARVFSEKKVMPTPAQALVVMNLAQRMIAKFYLNFRRDKHPLKIFRNTEEALYWLRSI